MKFWRTSLIFALSVYGVVQTTHAHEQAAAQGRYQLAHSIAIGGEGRWDYVYVDSQAHRAYVSHGTQTEVIDTRSDTLIGTVPDTAGVHGVAVASELGLGYTSNGKTNSVTVFDLKTLKPVSSIAVGTNPDAIVYVARSQRVVTFNGKSHDASIIDAHTGMVVGTVAMGGKPEFAQVDASGQVYVNIEDIGELAVLDPVAMTLTRRMSLKPCESPTGLAFDGHQRLYSVCENRIMMVTGTDGHVIAQAPIGSGADGVVWVGDAAISANGADGTLTVVRERAPGVMASETVKSVQGARTIDADTVLNKLYLPVADLKPGKSGERRASVPDTFKVLVFERK